MIIETCLIAQDTYNRFWVTEFWKLDKYFQILYNITFIKYAEEILPFQALEALQKNLPHVRQTSIQITVLCTKDLGTLSFSVVFQKFIT